MSDTPRTDEFIRNHGNQTKQQDFARSLERELNEAIRKLSYGCASEQDFMDFRNRHYELEKERDQLKAELEQFHEVNFRQAQKINDINGARNAFYNELAQALGIDPQNEENPSIVGEIKKIKAELSESRKSGKKLNAQVLKISDWLDLTIKHRDQWHDLSVKMFDVCMEVAAHGSCDCNIPEGIQCDFCVAGECVSQFNAMEKGKE